MNISVQALENLTSEVPENSIVIFKLNGKELIINNVKAYPFSNALTIELEEK